MARHFLKDDDVSSAEQLEILELALELKKDRFSQKPFDGPQTVAVIFDKTSTRTRVSFATGISDLGGVPLIIESGASQLGAKESVSDTARVLERQVAQIIWRTYSQAGLEQMAAHSAVPVINALSDDWHPCQLLADLLTIKEHFGKTQGLKLAYVGDANNNMANSYLVACAIAGMDLAVAAPFGFRPKDTVVLRAQSIAQTLGRTVEIFENPADAVAGAHVIATDTWVSMGMEHEKAARIETFANYTVDQELMDQASQDAVFLHCLPAYRGYEVSAEVIDGPRSLVWDEAENRLHAQKALMLWLSRQS